MIRTSVADTCVVDFNPNFVGFGRSNLNIFNAKVFSGLPGDSGLAGNGLQSRRHKISIVNTNTQQSRRDVNVGHLSSSGGHNCYSNASTLESCNALDRIMKIGESSLEEQEYGRMKI